MNQINLIGNMTKDPEVNTNGDTTYCRFSIAVDRDYKEKDGSKKTDFFNITAFRGTAENIGKYCHKGTKVFVSGSVHLDKYTDKDGVEKTGVSITARNVEFLDRKSDSDSESGNRREPEIDDDDGDIPF